MAQTQPGRHGLPANKPVKSLQLRDLQHALHTCDRQAGLRHELRRECLRRAQAWGRLANVAGSIILLCLGLIVAHEFIV